jgi:hypothetical protein
VVNAAADLAQFVQRRELLAYEQRVARAAYAYGVDLRRAAWLDHSTLGEPLMRTVDRRWTELVGGLAADVLEPPERPVPTEVIEELSRLIRLLRAPLPALRRLRPSASADEWPIATPLGTTRGGCHWLVLDVDRLMSLDATARAFLLGAALGDLQCDHGPLYAAHLMAHRGQRFSMVRSLLRPWSRVAVFSGDRAGLLAVGELLPTLEAVRLHGDPGIAWTPALAPMSMRIQALEDFDRSRVMARLRLTFAHRNDWSVIPPPPSQAPPSAGPPPVDETPAVTTPTAETARRAAPSPPGRATENPRSSSPATDTESGESSDSPSFEDVVEAAERMADGIADEREAEEQQEDATANQRAIDEQIAKAWPLARCDARLTRRLGLL